MRVRLSRVDSIPCSCLWPCSQQFYCSRAQIETENDADTTTESAGTFGYSPLGGQPFALCSLNSAHVMADQ